MNHTAQIAAGIIAVLASGTLTLADDNNDIEQMQQEINALRREVAQLRAEQNSPLTEQRAAEIRDIVNDVLADANSYTSLQDSGALAGYDGKFFLASADGNFRLNIEGQIQFRWVLDVRDGANDADPLEDDTAYGFEMRRTKLKFSGHVIDPSIKFLIQLAASRNDSENEVFLEDATIAKDYGNGWMVEVGRRKLPFAREELVSSKRQLAVERSLVNAFSTVGRSVGIMASYHADQFRAMAMLSNGRGSTFKFLETDAEIAMTGRIEYLVTGTWKQFADFTSWSGDEFGLLLGGAVHYEKAEAGTSGPAPTFEGVAYDDFFTWTVDASAEFGGANLFGSIFGRHPDTPAGPDPDIFGFVIQGGWHFVPDEWELFARYEWADADTAGVDDLNVVTFGVNRYLNKHALKWTTDFGYAFDGIDGLLDSSGAGWGEDAANEDGQFVVRTQLQLLF